MRASSGWWDGRQRRKHSEERHKEEERELGKDKRKDHRGGKEKEEISKRKQPSQKCICLPSRWEEDGAIGVATAFF